MYQLVCNGYYIIECFSYCTTIFQFEMTAGCFSRMYKWALIVTRLFNEPSSFVANWLKKIRWLFPRLFQNHWLSCFSTITVTISNILRLKTDLHINLFPQFSFSHCQWRWLDLNPRPWGVEASVLPLCYRFWPIGRHHLLHGVVNSKYKLLPFSTKKTFLQSIEGTSF
jgi:hypothetical protein